MDVAINAINGFWHVECFVCHRCNKKFEGAEGVKDKTKDGGVKDIAKEEDGEREGEGEGIGGGEEGKVRGGGKEERDREKEEKKKEVEGGKREEKREEEEGKRKNGREEQREKDGEGKKEEEGKDGGGKEEGRRREEMDEEVGEKEEGGRLKGMEEGEEREDGKKRREVERSKKEEDGHCSYTVKDDKLFHFECYKEEFFERCYVCKRFCENEYYQTEGKAVHEGCLENFKDLKKHNKEIQTINKNETGTCFILLFSIMICDFSEFLF